MTNQPDTQNAETNSMELKLKGFRVYEVDSSVIADRVISEAKALLQHTDWSVADIAYGLGYDYPTYFNNFFKKMTGASPKSFRA